MPVATALDKLVEEAAIVLAGPVPTFNPPLQI
jgi:hypothetical protein